MINSEILDLAGSKKWNEYLDRLPVDQQDIYFTPGYYSIYEQNAEGTARCFAFEKDGDIALYPHLINPVNELGYDLNGQFYDIQGAYGYNGIVSSHHDRDFISAFYSSFNDYIKSNNIIAEFTRFHPVLQNHFFQEDMDVIEDRKTVLLDISRNIDFIWENCYTGNNRNMIRKARKNNISISISDDESSYAAFSDIYRQTMRNNGADDYYYFSDTYFKNFKTLLTNSHRLISAKIDGETICAMILLFHGKYAHYHLSGRLISYSDSGVNNLILDEAVRIAKDEGCTLFHFGGGRTNLQNDSLLKFKSNFSRDQLTFYFGKKIHNKNVYDEIIKQWELKNPDKIDKYDNFLLKYRY